MYLALRFEKTDEFLLTCWKLEIDNETMNFGQTLRDAS